MSKPILVGYDPRGLDRAPVLFGVAAARFTGAPLVVLAVKSDSGIIPLGSEQTVSYAIVDDDLLDDVTKELGELEADLRTEGVRVEVRPLIGTSAAKALHEAAEHDDAGLLVVGSSRRSKVGQVLPGSTAERLIHGAPCPVAVVPHSWDEKDRPSTIGVAYLDSEEAHEALRGAHALARRCGATLRVLSVVEEKLTMYGETEPKLPDRAGKDILDVEGEYMLRARRQIQSEIAHLGDDVPIEIDVLAGDPAEALAEVSGHLDLLVCGSRGYGPLRAVLLGSVTRRLTSEARCPVIVLPRGVRNSLDALVAESTAAV
jgi:nucleotide-binding universal stress UspA family protein